MTKVNELRNILKETFSNVPGNAGSILKAIVVKNMEDSKIEAFIEKQISIGKFTFSELEKIAKNEYRKANRTKHTFNNFDELNVFTASHNCGNSWIDGEKLSVYEY